MPKIRTVRRNLRVMRLSRLLYRISLAPILEEGLLEEDLPCFDDYNPQPLPERRISRAELQLLFGKELGANIPAGAERPAAASSVGHSVRARQPSNLPYLLRASVSA